MISVCDNANLSYFVYFACIKRSHILSVTVPQLNVGYTENYVLESFIHCITVCMSFVQCFLDTLFCHDRFLYLFLEYNLDPPATVMVNNFSANDKAPY